jgi:hypothetical protein
MSHEWLGQFGHPRTELRMYGGKWEGEIVLQCRLYPKGTVHHTAPSLLRRRRHHGSHIIGELLDTFPARPPWPSHAGQSAGVT